MLRVNDVCFSRVGLWILSGQACGGICGPRFRWEEEQLEAKHAVYDPDTEQAYYTRGYPAPDNSSGIMSTWGWRECTRARIQEAFEFCLVLPLSTTRANEKARERVDDREKGIEDGEEAFEGIERVLQAAGIPGSNTAAPPRRGALRGELYETPPEMHRDLPKEYHGESPVPARKSGASSRGSKTSSKGSKPSSKGSKKDPIKYPFVGYPAQASSEDPQPGIPFPPSPTKSSAKRRSKESKHSRSASDRERGSNHGTADVDVAVEGTDDHADDHEREDEDEYDDDFLQEYEMGVGAEEPSSSGRASGSMSSLGQQIPSRFPFQFRHVQRRGRSSIGTQSKSMSSGRTRDSISASISASLSASMSTPDRSSHARSHTQSQQSQSPSHDVSSSGFHSPSEAGSGPSSPASIPMPPRHPHRRDRTSLPSMSDVAAIAFPPFSRSLGPERTRTESASTTASRTFGPQPIVYESSGEEDEQTHVDEMGVNVGHDSEGSQDGSQEAAEREDSVGLLSGGRSPRSSLGGLRSRSNLSLANLSHHRRSRQSSSASNHSMSVGVSVRSRAQSLIQSLGAASRSSISIEMAIRSRADSLARVSEVGSLGSGRGEQSFANSNSGSGSHSHSHSHGIRSEEHTFGRPVIAPETIESSGDRSGSNGASRNRRAEDIPLPPSPSEPELETVEETPGVDEGSPTVSASQSQSTTPRALAVPAALQPVQPPPPPPPIPTPTSRLQPERSFVSSAHDSLVTAPATTEGSSDTPGRSVSTSYGTIRPFAPDQPPQGGGGWHPA